MTTKPRKPLTAAQYRKTATWATVLALILIGMMLAGNVLVGLAGALLFFMGAVAQHSGEKAKRLGDVERALAMLKARQGEKAAEHLKERGNPGVLQAANGNSQKDTIKH